MRFAQYDRQTGAIYQVSSMPLGDGFDEVQVDDFVTDSTHYIEFATRSAVPFPARPSAHHTWNWGANEWEDARSLTQVKTLKNAEINAARLKANRGSFTFEGKQIACDELSRSDIDGVNGIVTLLQSLPPDWIGAWKTVDNDWVPILDVATWAQFYGAMVAQGQVNFSISQGLKADLESATTKEEVEAIVWPE